MLYVANTITDLVVGDISQHLPIQRLPLTGDVVGLGTTTSIDNGELSFIYNTQLDQTQIYKGNPNNAAAELQSPTSELIHFPYVCYTSNANPQRINISPDQLPSHHGKLQPMIEALLDQEGITSEFCGIRLRVSWRSLVITVASKLCLWQQRRYGEIAQSVTAASVYGNLQHFKLGDQPSEQSQIRYLGQVSDWYLSGFYARQPENGLVTVPQAGQNLHIHGCSVELSHGGHVHHEHPETELLHVHELYLYPIHQVQTLKTDLNIQNAVTQGSQLSFEIHNIGQLDASNVDVDVVANNQYQGKRFFRLPWLVAGSFQSIQLDLQTLPLQPGRNQITILVDPNNIILERLEANNSCHVEYQLES